MYRAIINPNRFVYFDVYVGLVFGIRILYYTGVTGDFTPCTFLTLIHFYRMGKNRQRIEVNIHFIAVDENCLTLDINLS